MGSSRSGNSIRIWGGSVAPDPEKLVRRPAVVTILGHGHPEWYDLPVNPHVPLGVKLWKSVVRPLGVIAAFATVLGFFGHYAKYGPKVPPDGLE